MIRALGWFDIHLFGIAAVGAIANVVTVSGNGVDWYERPAWLVSTGCALAVEWLIAFWWWEKHRHRRGGWIYVVVNQLVVLLLFAAGILVGMEFQHPRSVAP